MSSQKRLCAKRGVNLPRRGETTLSHPANFDTYKDVYPPKRRSIEGPVSWGKRNTCLGTSFSSATFGRCSRSESRLDVDGGWELKVRNCPCLMSTKRLAALHVQWGKLWLFRLELKSEDKGGLDHHHLDSVLDMLEHFQKFLYWFSFSFPDLIVVYGTNQCKAFITSNNLPLFISPLFFFEQEHLPFLCAARVT